MSYRQPDGTPKDTGRTLHESIVTVRIDDTTAPNGRVVIHVEHPGHDAGVRAFYRHRDSNLDRTIRSHLRRELDAEPTRVEVIDDAEVGLSEADILNDGEALVSTSLPEATKI